MLIKYSIYSPKIQVHTLVHSIPHISLGSYEHASALIMHGCMDEMDICTVTYVTQGIATNTKVIAIAVHEQ